MALPIPNVSVTAERNHTKPAHERVRNYPVQHVQRCLDMVIDNAQYPQFAAIIPAGLTQQSNIHQNSYSSDTDDDHSLLRGRALQHD